MRVCSVVVLALLALLALVDAKTLRQKQADLLKRAENAADGVLMLNAADYDVLTAKPRDYSSTVLYTVSPSLMHCAACEMVFDPFRELARGWKKHSQRRRHVIALIDAADEVNRQTFLRLGIQQVPLMRHHRATAGKYATGGDEVVDYDLVSNGLTSDNLADELSSFLKLKVRPSKPLLTPFTIGVTVGMVLAVLAAVFVIPHLSFQGGARGIAMIFCVVLVINFTSGQMWTRIRNPPFVMRGQDGLEYFASGLMSQHGIESTITSALYGALAVLVVVLVTVIPKIRAPAVQNLVLFITGSALLFTFSLLIDFFIRKMCVSNAYQPSVSIPSVYLVSLKVVTIIRTQLVLATRRCDWPPRFCTATGL